jgi:hypothetical protein
MRWRTVALLLDIQGAAGANWSDLEKTMMSTEAQARSTGKRFEIRVTVTGLLRTTAHPSPRGPCDRSSWGLPGYGHLGAFPAQIVVDSFRDVEVKESPQSPYDYANIYHGPA